MEKVVVLLMYVTVRGEQAREQAGDCCQVRKS